VHPARAIASIPRVGGTKTPRLERILELEPTHVLVNVDENRREDAQWLAHRVPTVVVTHPVEVEDHFELFARFGALWDRHAEARALEARLSELLDRLSARPYDPLPVLYLIWSDPWMTVGPDTYISRMLARVGLINRPVCGSTDRYPVVMLERLAAAGIAAVLLSSEPYRFRVADRRRLRGSVVSGDACRPSVPILGIDGEMCSWYGSRVIQGLEYLADYRRRLDARVSHRGLGRGEHGAS
jgi:ABC-type Fe3+-hydroxamate transport system substrate-binding protein